MSIIPQGADTVTALAVSRDEAEPAPVPITTGRGTSNIDWAARRLRGQAVDCGIVGCDRTDHDGNDPIEYWLHRVRSVAEHGLKLDAYVSDGRTLVYARSDIDEDRGMDAAELRGLAKQLEKQAEFVRSHADWLDPDTRTLRRPVNLTEALRSREG